MCGGGRYFYSVFMCHLSVEKALKGLYHFKLNKIPPKTHNLVYLLNCMEIKPGAEIGKIIVKLNEANITTRYPDDLDILQKNYNKEISEDIISQVREVLEWIKKQF